MKNMVEVICQLVIFWILYESTTKLKKKLLRNKKESISEE
jgi:hypothetical protein